MVWGKEAKGELTEENAWRHEEGPGEMKNHPGVFGCEAISCAPIIDGEIGCQRRTPSPRTGGEAQVLRKADME